MKVWKKILSLMMAGVLAIPFGIPTVAAGQKTATVHMIEAGESFEGNPLKGLMPYVPEDETITFPHSLEWFYLPVNAVQSDMDCYDWSALEKELDAVAGRGHQAVFRFYYDYPGVTTGIPQFVIDHGLTLREYNEPDALGGGGLCPDYSNEYFRDSMQAFIREFGKQYDGDGRIGFITVGLLGFWGEWHNWPYDEDTSDGKADWSIPTEVYKEVLDAYTDAFKTTKLCVREPKSGIDFSKYAVGYHDDSFGYATLSQKNGGQDWSFMQKMLDAQLDEIWQMECIGGEVYPPSQQDIFSGNAPVNGNFQDWDLCVSETHASWQLCYDILNYSGTALQNAKRAAKSLGYDLQVTKAIYPDVNEGTQFDFSVAMKNNGVAPFYYGHEVWPVVVALEQDGQMLMQTEMDWDLSDVQADQQEYVFSGSMQLGDMDLGEYTLCMKVQNPVENGNILGFANANQGNDGWLRLGTVQLIEEATEEPSSEVSTEEVAKEPSSEVSSEEVPKEPSSEVSTEEVAKEPTNEIKTEITTTESTEKSTVKGTSIKRIVVRKNSIKLYFKKVSGISGYEIQYATKKGFSNKKKVYCKKKNAGNFVIKKVKTTKRYYLRIRTYKKVNGKVVYSSWSKKMRSRSFK